jgi:predicted nucleotidyltransferase
MGIELDRNQKEAIARYLEILSQVHRDQISKVILFGSVARGDFSPESHILVEYDTIKPIIKERILAEQVVIL